MTASIDGIIQGMRLKEQELEAIAHNLANANTQGYKENLFSFESVLSKAMHPYDFKDRLQVRAPVLRPEANNYINFDQGAILQTGNALDAAIEGKGFFEIETAHGTRYTRNGTFALDAQGYLVNTKGDRVIGRSGPIQVSRNGNVQIGPNGSVQVDGQDQGQIKLVEFAQLQKLISAGEGYFEAPSEAGGTVSDHSKVLQGKVEASNVNTVENLSRMLEVNRLFETYAKVIKANERMNQETASVLGRIG